MKFSSRFGGRLTSAFAVLALTVSGLGVAALAAPSAAADVSSIVDNPPGLARTDALPTAQINGVVWQQAIVGDTVYAGGSFTAARPAGFEQGVSEVPRSNLMAYRLSSGLLDSFAPTVDGQVFATAVSPDGTRLYVGGDFQKINGVGRYRIAAFDTATKQLISSFAPIMEYRVNSIVATNTTVYVGGDFASVNGVARRALAAIQASNGALTTWNPITDAEVKAMTLSPDGSRLIVGGRFTKLNGQSALGLGAVNATTGATLPFAANQTIGEYGTASAVTSLKSDGQKIYGTTYDFGGTANGAYEGVFAADPTTGNLIWIQDCHGDTYDSFPIGGVVYSVSHAHFCSNVGGFPESNPRSVNQRHALAFTSQATGTVKTNTVLGYRNLGGKPAPSMIGWFPDFLVGAYTGQSQAAWAVTGNSTYVVMGGEFRQVNGRTQQGLVRFATTPTSPGKVGPQLTGSAFTASALALGSGTVRVLTGGNWDPDNAVLTYQLIANGNTASPLATTTAKSTFWERPTVALFANNLVSGQSYSLRIDAVDGNGNRVSTAPVQITAQGTAPAAGSYSATVQKSAPGLYWRIDEAAGPTVYDWAGPNDGTAGAGVVFGSAGAVSSEPDKAATFSGTTSGFIAAKTAQSGPRIFTVGGWFKTSSVVGGQLFGFGSSNTGNSTTSDRTVYLDNAGRVNFGVSVNGPRTVSSTTAYNDGKWHHVAATLGTDGMKLYLDGRQVAARTDTTAAVDRTGYWRAGGDSLSGWTNAPTSGYLAGTIDEVAVFPTALSAAAVLAQYQAAKANQPPTAAFAVTSDRLKLTVDGSASTDPDGTVASYAWNFGDGATASGVTATHTYAAAGTYPVTLTVTDNGGKTGTRTQQVTVQAPPPNALPTAAFTSSTTALSAMFDGSGSKDTDGTIVSYAWKFGDGTTGTGSSPTHVYPAGGTHTATLTVTDNDGGTGTVSHPVTVTAPPPVNQGPTAAFSSQVTDLTAQLDASASSDPDGTIVSYAWNFGDGTTATGKTTSHTYGSAKTWTVTLTVTDNAGATGTTSSPVTVTAPKANQPPVAAFTSSSTGLAVSVNGSTSSDPDGTITAYAWDFGDGATATGATASHTYQSAGTYQVTLKVTDDKGATNSVTKPVTTQTPANQPPVAAFTATTAGLAASFDGSTSTDDGTIASYAWSFGDGSTGTGKTISHTYPSAGTYPVKLTVTDNNGSTGSVTNNVTVTAPATQVYASDSFGRTVAAGFTSADIGGAYTLTDGSSAYSVNGSTGSIVLGAPRAGPGAFLNAVSVRDVDVSVDVSPDKAATGGASFFSLVARHSDTADYRAQAVIYPDGVVVVNLQRVVNFAETNIGTLYLGSMAFAAGDVLHLRLQVTGSGTTTVRGKAWKNATTEPADWQVSGTDTEPILQGAGGVGMRGYLSGTATSGAVTLRVDNLIAKGVG